MTSKKQKNYDDHELCQDIAAGTLTKKEIAVKHRLSERMVGAVAHGDQRPDLKPIIDRLSEAHVIEGKRIARSRVRYAMARLLELVGSDAPHPVTLKATMHLLNLAGLGQTDEVADELRAVVIKTPFAVDPSKIRSNGKGGDGKKNSGKGGNGKKTNNKRKK